MERDAQAWTRRQTWRIPLVLALACAGCGGGSAPAGGEARRLSIATGGTSGVYYVYGGALARVLSKKLPGVAATAEVTAASVENLSFVAQGSADLAFTLADTAYDAAQGRERFTSPLPLRTLAVLYRNVTHIGTRAASGITSLAGLRGRRVSTGSPGSGTEVIAERVLRAAGLDPARDIERERLGVGESASALKDGKVDAFFWSGGLPTAGILELASTPGMSLRLLSDAALVERLVREHGPLYSVVTIPSNLYPRTPSVDASSVWNLLVVHQDMEEELAYRLTKTLFEARDELATAHPAARELNPRTGAKGSPVAYHPGAIRYYKEVGAWPQP